MDTIFYSVSTFLLGIGLIVLSTIAWSKLRGRLWKRPMYVLVVGGLMLTGSSLINLLAMAWDPSYGGSPTGSTAGLTTYVAQVLSGLGFVTVLISICLCSLVTIGLQGSSEAGGITLPRMFTSGLREKLKDLFGERNVSLILYSLGKSVGRDFSKRLAMTRKYDPEQFTTLLSEIAVFANWAEQAEVSEYVPREVVVLRTYGSLDTLDGHSSAVPSCDFLRGTLAGVVEGLVQGTFVEAVEARCQSKGDDCCEFVANIHPALGLV